MLREGIVVYYVRSHKPKRKISGGVYVHSTIYIGIYQFNPQMFNLNFIWITVEMQRSVLSLKYYQSLL